MNSSPSGKYVLGCAPAHLDPLGLECFWFWHAGFSEHCGCWAWEFRKLFDTVWRYMFYQIFSCSEILARVSHLWG